MIWRRRCVALTSSTILSYLSQQTDEFSRSWSLKTSSCSSAKGKPGTAPDMLLVSLFLFHDLRVSFAGRPSWLQEAVGGQTAGRGEQFAERPPVHRQWAPAVGHFRLRRYVNYELHINWKFLHMKLRFNIRIIILYFIKSLKT